VCQRARLQARGAVELVHRVLRMKLGSDEAQGRREGAAASPPVRLARGRDVSSLDGAMA
jgi:hypothetical protein